MRIDERRRLALHRAAAGTWGEEVADTLAELIGPSGDEVATKDDVGHLGRRMDELDRRIDAMERRWDERLAALNESWDQRMEAMEHRITAAFERRIADAITTQTRTLVFSQLGALVVIAALAFGLR